jgi:16S rRNA C967 or C1407 C5-methylase (RsmB/RsmF family)
MNPEQLMDALNRPAPLDLRVNTIQSSVEPVLEALTAAAIPFERTYLRTARHTLAHQAGITEFTGL